jgi:hypothetical protein
MAKRAAKKRKQTAAARPAAEPLADLPIIDDAQAAASGFSLHDLFQQQAMSMLDRSDLSEEQKQSILVAMNCPCCGGSGLSFTAKLKRKSSKS